MWPSIAPSKPAAAVAAGWRIGAAVAAVAGYALLSCWLMVHAADRPWAVAVLFGPLVLAVAGSAWQRRQPWVLAACGLGVWVLIVVVARGGVEDINRLYVLEHGGFHLALAYAFGSTLRPGATPLITAMAATVHHQATPEVLAYTRRLTGLWAVYFVAMVGVSLAVYTLAPWPWWSFFGSIITPLAAAALFVIEHVLRYRRHPEFERVSLAEVAAAFRQSSAADGNGRS